MNKSRNFLIAALGALALLAGSCSSGGGSNDDDDTIAQTTFTATVDATSGTAIPDQFTVTIAYQIADSAFDATAEYSVHARFAGAVSSIDMGAPHTLTEGIQTGSGSYKVNIPASGLPAEVKTPYEMTFTLEKGVGETLATSEAYTFIPGPLTGTYTGDVHHGSNYYSYRIPLVQYGNRVLGTDAVYIDNSNIEHTEDFDIAMTVTATTSTTSTLKGTASYIGSSGKTSYSGEATVYGGGKRIVCDKYTVEGSTVAAGSFFAIKNGTSKVSGTIKLPAGTDTSAAPVLDGMEWQVSLLFTFAEGDMSKNSSRYVKGLWPTGANTITYTVENVPEGTFYPVFYIDTDDDGPSDAGEAIGLYGCAEADTIATMDTIMNHKEAIDMSKIQALSVGTGETKTAIDINAAIIPVAP